MKVKKDIYLGLLLLGGFLLVHRLMSNKMIENEDEEK